MIDPASNKWLILTMDVVPAYVDEQKLVFVEGVSPKLLPLRDIDDSTYSRLILEKVAHPVPCELNAIAESVRYLKIDSPYLACVFLQMLEQEDHHHGTRNGWDDYLVRVVLDHSVWYAAENEEGLDDGQLLEILDNWYTWYSNEHGRFLATIRSSDADYDFTDVIDETISKVETVIDEHFLQRNYENTMISCFF
jgi:hypothetical protein